MRRFVVLLIFVCLQFVQSTAQEVFTLLDTVLVEEVVSYGKLQKYQSGSRIEKISSGQFQRQQDGNLEQLLSRAFPVPLKTNAGGLSTIRMRGAGPDHTSINFGGININSMTLGHSNVSGVPLYLFDNVGIQFGSASSVNGSGSIGGAIHLGLINNWTKGVKAEVRIANGSFGEQLYGTKLFLGNGKFESVTRAYYYYKRNDFTFTNPYFRDFENGIFEIEDRQHNANVENMGILQELNYRFSRHEFLVFNAWLESNWQLAQQNMPSNLYNPDKREEYEDNHIRIWSGYRNRKNPVKFEINGGYVRDFGQHNANSEEKIITQRIIGESFLEHDPRQGISYKVGLKASRIYPEVHAYENNIDHEDRIDLYASWYQQFLQRLTATLNLRQGWVSNYQVPFTPSLGLKYRAFSGEKYVLNLNGNVSRSYRVPTFNDRYWVPGGNPDLEPEKGMNYELGANWRFHDGKQNGNVKLGVFFMVIDDWILWKNGGAFWYAENVQKVHSKGLEFATNWDYHVIGLKHRSALNYALTSAERVESITQTGALNRQLEYVPVHAGNYSHTAFWNEIGITLDGTYTGQQYTDEEEKNILDARFLLNVSLSYLWQFSSDHRVRINGMVNNVLDKDYQSSWSYAMPGVNYRISLTYSYN